MVNGRIHLWWVWLSRLEKVSQLLYILKSIFYKQVHQQVPYCHKNTTRILHLSLLLPSNGKKPTRIYDIEYWRSYGPFQSKTPQLIKIRIVTLYNFIEIWLTCDRRVSLFLCAKILSEDPYLKPFISIVICFDHERFCIFSCYVTYLGVEPLFLMALHRAVGTKTVTTRK